MRESSSCRSCKSELLPNRQLSIGDHVSQSSVASEWTEMIEETETVDKVCLDIAEASDIVPPLRCLANHQGYGARDQSLD